MSGVFPNSPAPASINITSISPTRVSVSHAMKRHVRGSGSQRWVIESKFSLLRREKFAPLYAFAVKQEGQAGSFTYVPPGYDAPRGSVSGNVAVDGASQTGKNIALKDLPVSTNGVFKAMDFIKFTGHSKVYMVTDDVNSDDTGRATASLNTALLSSPGDAELITYNSVPFTVALTSDSVELLTRAPFLGEGFTIEMIEDV